MRPVIRSSPLIGCNSWADAACCYGAIWKTPIGTPQILMPFSAKEERTCKEPICYVLLTLTGKNYGACIYQGLFKHCIWQMGMQDASFHSSLYQDVVFTLQFFDLPRSHRKRTQQTTIACKVSIQRIWSSIWFDASRVSWRWSMVFYWVH